MICQFDFPLKITEFCLTNKIKNKNYKNWENFHLHYRYLDQTCRIVNRPKITSAKIALDSANATSLMKFSLTRWTCLRSSRSSCLNTSTSLMAICAVS